MTTWCAPPCPSSICPPTPWRWLQRISEMVSLDSQRKIEQRTCVICTIFRFLIAGHEISLIVHIWLPFTPSPCRRTEQTWAARYLPLQWARAGQGAWWGNADRSIVMGPSANKLNLLVHLIGYSWIKKRFQHITHFVTSKHERKNTATTGVFISVVVYFMETTIMYWLMSCVVCMWCDQQSHVMVPVPCSQG